MMKKGKNKKKSLKGFTLVELLAVIVILAIIMIIAIPAVLNTMQTARKKSMITYAQRIMNEAEKKYVEKQTFEALKKPATETGYIFDIKTDLGLTNTGDNYGYVVLYKIDGFNEMWFEILLVNKNYTLYFTTYHEDDEEQPVLGMDNIDNTDPEMISNLDGDIGKFPFKKWKVIQALVNRCNYFSEGYVDVATNTQLYCPNGPHNGNVDDLTGECDAENALDDFNVIMAAMGDTWTNCE